MRLHAKVRRFGLAGVAAVALAALPLTQPAATANGVTATAIPYGATDFKYQVVEWGAGAGFEQPSFDDSAWASGAAGFGTTEGACSWNNSTDVKTAWPVDTDLLVRKEFNLPAGAHNLQVTGTVDNDATVYVNGQQVGSVQSGHCATPNIQFSASDGLLLPGNNVVAVRGHDYGVAAFLDFTVTYEAPEFQVCPLFDQSRSYKAGSAVPVKLQLCDVDGVNRSASSITVHATGLKKVDSSASASVEDTGESNSDDDYRFDPELGETGGYVYNLSTKGLSTGTWKASFSVDGISESNYYVTFDVR